MRLNHENLNADQNLRISGIPNHFDTEGWEIFLHGGEGGQTIYVGNGAGDDFDGSPYLPLPLKWK